MPTNREAVFSLAASKNLTSGTQLLALAALAEHLGMQGEATALVERAYNVFDIARKRVCEDSR